MAMRMMQRMMACVRVALALPHHRSLEVAVQWGQHGDEMMVDEEDDQKQPDRMDDHLTERKTDQMVAVDALMKRRTEEGHERMVASHTVRLNQLKWLHDLVVDWMRGMVAAAGHGVAAVLSVSIRYSPSIH